MAGKPQKQLPLCEVNEYGVEFKTGQKVRFHYIRNTEKSPRLGSRFGQDIEPVGRYLLHNPNPGDIPKGWETGEVTFNNPLVLQLTTDEQHIYGEGGWKAQLHRAYKRKRSALSCKLKAEGFDGIVTCDNDGYTREIVDLAPVKCAKKRS